MITDKWNVTKEITAQYQRKNPQSGTQNIKGLEGLMRHF